MDYLPSSKRLSDRKTHWDMVMRHKWPEVGQHTPLQRRSSAQLVTRGWVYILNSDLPLFAEPCFLKIITVLTVLTACFGVTSVCLSWCWVKVSLWLHWVFRFCFVIKTESQRLKKTAAGPWKPSLCHTVLVDPWSPPLRAVHVPNMSWQQAWQSTGMQSQKHRAAVGLWIGTVLTCSPPAPCLVAAQQLSAVHSNYTARDWIPYSSIVRGKEGFLF